MYIDNKNQLFRHEAVQLDIPAISTKYNRWGTYTCSAGDHIDWVDGTDFAFSRILPSSSEVVFFYIRDNPTENEIGSFLYWQSLDIIQPHSVWVFFRIRELIFRNYPQWSAFLEILIEGDRTISGYATRQATLSFQYTDEAVNRFEVTYSVPGIQRNEQYLDEYPPSDVLSEGGETRLVLNIQRLTSGIQTLPPQTIYNNLQYGPVGVGNGKAFLWDRVGEIIKRPRQGQTSITMTSDEIIDSFRWDTLSPLETLQKADWNNSPYRISNSISNKWGETIRIQLVYQKKTNDPLLPWINFPVNNLPNGIDWGFRDFTIYPFTRGTYQNWLAQREWLDIFPRTQPYWGLELYNTHARLSGASVGEPNFSPAGILKRVTDPLLWLFITVLDYNDEIIGTVNGVPFSLICGIDFEPEDDLSLLLDSTYGLPAGTWIKGGSFGREWYYWLDDTGLNTIDSVTDRGNWADTYVNEFGGWLARGVTNGVISNPWNHSHYRYPRYVNKRGEVVVSLIITMGDDRYNLWFPEFSENYNVNTRIKVYSDTGRPLANGAYAPVNNWEFNMWPHIQQQTIVIGGVGNDIRATDKRVFVTCSTLSVANPGGDLEYPQQIEMMDELLLRDDVLESYVLVSGLIGGWIQIPIIKAQITETQTDTSFQSWNPNGLSIGSVSNITNWNPEVKKSTTWEILFTIPMVSIEAAEWYRKIIQSNSRGIFVNKGDCNTPVLVMSYLNENLLMEGIECTYSPDNLSLTMKANINL